MGTALVDVLPGASRFAFRRMESLIKVLRPRVIFLRPKPESGARPVLPLDGGTTAGTSYWEAAAAFNKLHKECCHAVHQHSDNA